MIPRKLNYKICEELRDEGFHAHTSNDWFTDSKHVKVYYPSLSELIDWCGDSFEEVRNTQALTIDLTLEKWMATAISDKTGRIRHKITRGLTPELAVANLVLEIKRDKTWI